MEDPFKANQAKRFPAQGSAEIFALCKDQARLEATSVHRFMALIVI
ncbi:hypothetical protein [Pseudomonas extremaustralis]|nr:hypothetical protein [Pseudomonas extremaustralis]